MLIWETKWININGVFMKDVLAYPKCKTNKDVELFKSFMLEKITPIFLKFKGKVINDCTLMDFKNKLIDSYPIVQDIKHKNGSEVSIEFDEIFLFSKNLIINKDGQIELNDGSYKMSINKNKEIKIKKDFTDYSKISDNIYYVVR